MEYWRRWLSKSSYTGRWREVVHRSALTLKLLTFEPTGAIVAAPTSSLPEGIGGERNWDYRYTWIRDAAFTLYGLLRIGFTEEAEAFMGWLEVRDEIYEDIMDKGWSPERKAFVQSYGSDTLDASNLIMPLVFFLSPKDPRMLSTLDAINRPPKDGGLVSNGLVFRYDVEKSADGLMGEEGTFSLCTFWLVEALTRAGRLEEARLIFEQMLGYANHLGLYAEEIGPNGEALGNFPQAFTHLTLISAAYNLDRALGKGK